MRLIELWDFRTDNPISRLGLRDDRIPRGGGGISLNYHRLITARHP